ncbi:DNA polymerase/3'-5' exonuclease PolX [bacterium]|nr:DNA polymerase/3'-5' exonuclease PolX [bacterium]
MTNKEIARILYEMAAYLEMQGIDFKPRAYEKAASQIADLETEASELYKRDGLKGLTKISYVGKSMAEHIEDLIKNGTFAEYQRMKRDVPVDVSELMQIEGLGPKKIFELWKKLKIRNLADLEQAANSGKIRSLSNFGEKSEQKILKGLQFLQKSAGRQLLGYVLPEAKQLEQAVRALPEVKEALLTGSLRRRKETIGDIDLVVVSKKPEKVMESFRNLPMVAHVIGSGSTKTSIKLKNGSNVDLRVVPEDSLGAALVYFTGSKDHCIALREIAIKKELKLNEYGLYKGNRRIAGKTEQEIYHALGLEFIEPEMRENCGEIKLAKEKRLPKLIDYGDLKGDLQVQTNWTDGEHSMEEMALAAEKQGLEYIVITDHTQSLAMMGSDQMKLMKQMKEIDNLNKKLQKEGHKIQVLKGAEVNIMKDGTLDMPDEILGQLDVVGAAVHSFMHLPREEQTKRVLKAMENPNVDILFHPTSRKILARDPIDVDMEAVIDCAKRTDTVLEIDAHPERLDLRDEWIRRSLEAGVKLSIDSDAHSVSHFRHLELGIAQARRGWATKKDIVNTKPVKEFLSLLKNGKPKSKRKGK